MEPNATQAAIAPPIFIKANFAFKTPEHEYSFLNQPVSVFGVSGLRWNHFDPLDRVGAHVDTTVDVLSRVRFRIKMKSLLTAELTEDATYLGMRFQLEADERARLIETIRGEGFYPTAYIRKFPRIPGNGMIYNMPLRAIVGHPDGELIAFDIANMSPNGILLHTENPKASIFTPGERLTIQVDPRGEVFQSFRFDGVVCRMVLEKNPETRNITRMLGIRILRLEPADTRTFLGILRLVLHNIQTDGLVGGS